MKTLLQEAVEQRQVEAVSKLILEGADVDAKDKDNDTPLLLALRPSYFLNKGINEDIIKILLNAGANVHLKDNYKQDSPLHYAVYYCNSNIVKLLIDVGSKVNARNKYEETPLHSVDDFEIAKLLLDAGAKIDARDEFSYTPLHHKVESVKSDLDVKIIKLFLEAGADVNASNISGFTILHNAVTATESDSKAYVLKLLIEAGAKINATDYEGETPLYRVSNPDIIQFDTLHFLVKTGADLNERTSHWNHTPYTLLIKSLKYEKASTRILISETLKLYIDYIDINLVNADGRNIIAKILDSSGLLKLRHFFYKIILEYIAKLKALDNKIDSRLLNTISGNNDYSKYFLECENELTRARTTKIKNSWVTFFNLVVDNESRFVKYAGNENLIYEFQHKVNSFPIYSAVMKTNVSKGIDRRKLFDKVAKILSYYCPIFDPYHLIIRGIVNTLNEEDWKKLSENNCKRVH